MTTVHITFGQAVPNARVPGQPGLLDGASARSETITTPATSTLSATTGDNVVTIEPTDGAVWAAVGDTPDAGDGNSDGVRAAVYIASGRCRELFVAPGQSVAVEDA